MPTCGSCKQEGQTVEHVRECYAAKRASVATVEVTGLAKEYVESRDFRPMALNIEVPASKYALPDGDDVAFFEIRIGKPGTRWDGFRFVDRLVGHPGDWMRYPVKGQARKDVLAAITSIGAKESAILFSKRFTVCAVCGSPLSDPESMERGLGPVCVGRF